MTTILLVIHVLAAIAIVALVLLQQGRGADMGAAFGGGSQTLFGARGSANFLTKVTALLAAVFFFTSLSLAFLYGRTVEPTSVTDQVPEQAQQPAPATDGSDIPTVPDSATQAPQTDIPQVPGGEVEGRDGTGPESGTVVPESPK